MKKILIILFVFPIMLFGQCPDAKSNEYKNKLQKYGDGSYATLATYYYRICQCKNGIGNGSPEQMANMINGLVDTYNTLKRTGQNSTGISGVSGVHMTEWVTIYKVKASDCKGISKTKTNQNNENLTNKESTEEKARIKEEQDNAYYANAVSNATISLLNKDYQASTLEFTELAIDGIVNTNDKNLFSGLAGVGVNLIAQGIERRRLEKLELEKKKKAFDKLANDYRNKISEIVNGRFTYLKSIPTTKSTLKEDGSDFKPIYIYFAYADNSYAQYKEDIKFPDKIQINFTEEAPIHFSQVYGVFPYSNGEYPPIERIKTKILKDYFGDKVRDKTIVFFPWEKSINEVVNSLLTNINNSVKEGYFTNAYPSQKKEITFILRKKSNINSTDYWSKESIKKKDTTKINYWKN